MTSDRDEKAGRRKLGRALGLIPSGLFIISTAFGQRRAGFLASWVQQVSFEPLMVAFSIAQDRPMLEMLVEGCPVVIHILPEGERTLMRHFAKGFKPESDPFEGLDLAPGRQEAPVLRDVLAHIECRVVDRCEAGDHMVIFAEALAAEVNDPSSRPAVHVRTTGLGY